MDELEIRPGRLEDVAGVREFTQNTFHWGDYVADVFPDWVTQAEKGEGDVLVAVVHEGDDEKVVGVNHVRYLSPDEAWFEGIRVRPEYRRSGIGRMLTASSIGRARERGVKLCRAAIDSDNEKSQGLARSFGFRPVATIIQLELDAAGFLGGQHDQRATERGEKTASRKDKDSQAGPPEGFSVRPATLEEVLSVYRIVSAEAVRIIGGDYTWWSVTPENVTRLVASGKMLVAVDANGAVAAGAVADEDFETEVEEGAQGVLFCEASSAFGDEAGIRAIVAHLASRVAEEAAEKELSARLTVLCEDKSTAAGLLRKRGFSETSYDGRRDEIWIWELELR